MSTVAEQSNVDCRFNWHILASSVVWLSVEHCSRNWKVGPRV